MAVGSKFALTCTAGIGCAGTIPYVIKYRCSNPKERWVEPSAPFLTCTGNGATIDISLAFRNSVGGKNGNNANNLYLKGIDRKNGTEVNLYEELLKTGMGSEKRWQLIVFKEGTHQLHELSGRMDGNYNGDGLTCRGRTFQVIKGKPKESEKRWEQAISSITFNPFKRCTEKTGKEICDIEIAEGVGLKWGTNFNPKAHFCKSSK